MTFLLRDQVGISSLVWRFDKRKEKGSLTIYELGPKPCAAGVCEVALSQQIRVTVSWVVTCRNGTGAYARDSVTHSSTSIDRPRSNL